MVFANFGEVGAGDQAGVGRPFRVRQADVIQAGPEHQIVTTNKLGEPIYASPALSNGTIYIRGEQHLYAIR